MPNIRPQDLGTEVWAALGGGMLVLLRSIVDGTRRTAAQLIIGCVFGALGGAMAGTIWGDSKYVYLICGVAAIVTENVIVGLFNASKDFRDNPKPFFGWLWGLIVPNLSVLRNATQAAPPVATPTPAPPAAPLPPAAPATDNDPGAANG